MKMEPIFKSNILRITTRKRYRVAYLTDKNAAYLMAFCALFITMHTGRMLSAFGIRYDEINKRYFYFRQV